MRKISPQDIRNDFQRQLTDLMNFYSAGKLTFKSEKNLSTLTEHSFLAAAVAWEGFVSDMFIGYINIDSTRFKKHLHDSFDALLQTQEKSNRVFKTYGNLQFPIHLNKADVQLLANNTGNNITFPNFSELEERAKKWRVPAHADKFRNITRPQKALINAVIGLRNHVAHRSQRSGEAMNELLAVGNLHSTGIRRGENNVNNIGVWLKATPVKRNESRIETIIKALGVIGASC